MSIEGFCQPCGEDGKRVQATKSCMECDERYCEICSQFHSAQKLTRNHELRTFEQTQWTEDINAQENNEDKGSNSEEEYEESYFMPSMSNQGDSSNKTSDEEQVEGAVSTSMELSAYQPNIPLVVRSESTSVLLKVSPPDNFNIKDNSNYILQLKKSLDEKWQRYPDQFSCTDKELSVSGLEPNSMYSVRVKLIDEESGDESQYSKGSDFFSTEKIVVPGKPELVKAKVRSILLCWSEVPGLTNDHAYELSYKCEQEGKWKNYNDTFTPGQRSYEVSGLKPSSKYRFRVRVIDENGDECPKSPISDILETQKELVIPGKPFQIKISQSSVKLRWDTKHIVLKEDDSFQLAYRSDNFETNHWNVVEQLTSDNEIVVYSLNAGTDYIFKVRVFNTVSKVTQDYSDCSDKIHTLEKTLQPGRPEAISTSHESIELKWRLIHSPEEKDDTEYQVWYRNMAEKSNWKLYEKRLCDPFHSVAIEDLEPATPYIFKVRKYRSDTEEESDYSPISEQIKTKEKKRIPGKPFIIEAEETSIIIQWESVLLDDKEIYEILYKSEKEKQWRISSNLQGNESNKIKVTNLEHNTKYKFKCRIKNKETLDNGLCGEESDWIATEEYIRKIIPTTPEEMNVTAKSVEVGWERPLDMSPSEFYELQFKESRPGTPWEVLQKYLQHDETMTTVEWLTPETDYIFRVRVVDPADEEKVNEFSKVSARISTLKKEDKRPGKPYCTDKQTESITISWDIPENIDKSDTFCIWYKEKGEEEWINTEYTLPHTQSTVEIYCLQPDTAYRFKVALINEADEEEGGSISDVIHTNKILKVPGIPVLSQNDSHSVKLIWEHAPEFQDDDCYMVAYRENNRGVWKEYISDNHRNNSAEIRNLKSGTTYSFKVKVVNKTSGTNGEYSNPIHDISTKQSPALQLSKQSKRIFQGNQGTSLGMPSRFQLPLRSVRGSRNDDIRTKKLELGLRKGSCREKTILLMGETGSGKSTLVNSLANYLLQIEYQDDVRFDLVYLEKEENSKNQAQSITEWISTYIIHPSVGSRLNYTLNIVDMPGFGDTRGIEYDERTVSQLRHLFTSTSTDGLSHIDAVCFLLRAPDARLTTTQSYIFDSILSVFGKNIADNIFLMITFADTNSPEVLAAISKKDGLKDKPHFLFNNCSLYSSNEDETNSDFFWKKTMKSFDSFFDTLDRVQTKSLKLSAEVLHQRETIENTVLQLQFQVDITLSTICTLEREIEIFKKHKDTIKDNENFEYEVEEIDFIREDISGSKCFTTNCLSCNFTCHENCRIKEDSMKYNCVAMNKDGICKICPAACKWNLHANVPYIIRAVPKKVKKTYAEMQERYTNAEAGKLNQEDLIAKIGEEIDGLEDDIENKMEVITKCNNTLRDIALNPNPLSTSEYIQLMIDSEKREKKSGFAERIQALEKCRKRVEIDKTVCGVKERIKHMRNMTTDLPDLAELNIGKTFGKIKKKVLGVIKKSFPSKSKRSKNPGAV